MQYPQVFQATEPASRDAGTYAVTATGKGAYGGTATATYTIARKVIAVPRPKAVLVYSGQRQVGVAAGTALRFATNKAGRKKIAVGMKSGKVTLRKGLRPGAYKVKVRVTAPKGKNYKAAKAKTITLKVKITAPKG